MSAARLLRRAFEAGVRLHLDGSHVRLTATYPPGTELLTDLRSHKGEIFEILRGDRCRLCGAWLPWPEPAGIMLADGTAECMTCVDREAWRVLAAAERAVASPDALADEAEITIRGESLP